MKTSRSETKEIEIEVGDDFWKVEAHAEMYFDPNYGADADGHRGMPQWFIDEIKIHSWTKNDEFVKEKKVPKKVVKAMDKEIDSKDFDFWTPEEKDSDPDPDY